MLLFASGSAKSDYSFGAIWKNYTFIIPPHFENKTIKLGVIIKKTDCCDFSLLVDNITINKDCSKIEIDLKELKGQKIFPPSYYFT